MAVCVGLFMLMATLLAAVTPSALPLAVMLTSAGCCEGASSAVARGDCGKWLDLAFEGGKVWDCGSPLPSPSLTDGCADKLASLCHTDTAVSRHR